MWLWNGILAAAPGHSFLALTIALVTTQVKQRMYRSDIELTFCPHALPPYFHENSHFFLTGPSALGRVLNAVLYRSVCAGRPKERKLAPTAYYNANSAIYGGPVELLAHDSAQNTFGRAGHVLFGTPDMGDEKRRLKALSQPHPWLRSLQYRHLWSTTRVYTDTGRWARRIMGPIEWALMFTGLYDRIL